MSKVFYKAVGVHDEDATHSNTRALSSAMGITRSDFGSRKPFWSPSPTSFSKSKSKTFGQTGSFPNIYTRKGQHEKRRERKRVKCQRVKLYIYIYVYVYPYHVHIAH